MTNMLKKFTLTIASIVCFMSLLNAQSQVEVIAPVTCANAGQPHVFAITGNNLTDIGGMQIDLLYDTNVFTVDSLIVGADLDGIAQVSVFSPGIITLSWVAPAGGQTLPDGTTLFYVEGTGMGPQGISTDLDVQIVEVFDNTLPPVNIGGMDIDGSFTVGCFNLDGPTITAVTTDPACDDGDYVVDFIVDDFDSLVALQFTMMWDTDIIDYTFVDNLANLPNLDQASFGDLSDIGKLTFAWVSNFDDPKDLPDGTTLFSLHFNVVGDPGDMSQIMFTGDPTIIKATIPFNTEVPVTTANGSYTLVDTVPPSLECPADLTVANVMAMPSVVVNDIAPVVSDNCSATSVTYSLSGATIGSGNDDASGTAFNIGDTQVTYTATDAEGNASSCSFNIHVNDTLTLIAQAQPAQCGDTNYIVDILVENFTHIRGLQFTLVWDKEVLQYENTLNVNLPPTVGFGELTPDTLTFSWFDMDDSGESYPDGFSIFSIRFTVVGDVGDVTPISFIDHPTHIEASTNGGVPPFEVPVRTVMGSTTVIDDQPPVPPMAPGDIVVDCGADIPAGMPLVAQDLCDGPITADPVDDTTSLTCANQFTVERTWTFIDSEGNSVSISQTITVNDTIAPTFDFDLPEDVTVECDAVPPFFQPTANDVSDNCSPSDSIQILLASSIVQGDCPDESVITRSWQIVDQCGNSTTHSQTITVIDTVAPTINVPLPPADITVNCDNVPDLFIVDQDDVTDNCSDSITITAISSIGLGDCPNNYFISYSVSVSDLCGNTTGYGQTITVIDTTAPEFLVMLPGDVTVQCEEDVPTAPTVTAADVADNCSPSDSIEIVAASSISMGNCTDNFMIQRSWTITDECGNSTTVTQTITVNDTIAPDLDIPMDMVVECGAATDTTATGVATATDNCGEVTVTFQDTVTEGCGNTQVIERTWTATDDCGNTSSDVQVISVEDTTPPDLTLPGDLTVECGESTDTLETGTATAMDICGMVTITFSDAFEAACGNTGTITRTWTATDECGNSSTGDQTITIEDTTDPVFETDLPEDITVECDNIPAALVLTANDVSDNCSAAADITIDFMETTVDGSCVGESVITRTWTIEDECGNTAQHVQVVTVEDNTAPVLSCQDVTIQLDEDGFATIDDGGLINLVSVSDNCSGATVTASQVDFGCEDLGDNSVTLTATDDCGNTSTCVTTVTVEDNIPPTLNCPNDIVVSLDPGACDAIVNWTVTATDNCPLVGTFFSSGFEGAYDPSNWFTSVDGDGSIDVAGAPGSVTLVGANDGTANAETNLCINVAATGTLTFDWSYSSANASAFFDPFGYTINGTFTQLTTTAGGLNQSGTVSITVNAGDEFCFSQRSVDGIFGAGTTTISNFSGPFLINLQPTQIQGPPSGSTFEIGSTTIGYEITDLAGNTSQCFFDVIVNEFPNPIASLFCNDTVTVALEGENCMETVGADLVLEGGPYGCYDDYIIEIFDENGNSLGDIVGGDQIGQVLTVVVTDPETGNFCETILLVEDNIPPVVSCSDVTVSCVDSTDPANVVGFATTDTFFYDGAATPLLDGCPNGTDGLEIPINVSGAGSVVTDVNISLQIQHTWVGDVSAELQSPDGTIVQLFERPGTDDDRCFDTFQAGLQTFGCSADDYDTTFDDEAANSADAFENLCVPGMTGTYQPISSLSVFNGNNANGTWTLRVFDGVNTGIQTGTFLGASLEITAGELGDPQTFDACGDVTLTFDDEEIEGDCDDDFIKIINRVWTGTDESGNSSTCTQTITVERPTIDQISIPLSLDDIDLPSLSCENPDLDPSNTGFPTINGVEIMNNDLCGFNITFQDQTIEICEGSTKYLRTWFLTDWCTGEIVEEVQIIKVSDQTGPTLACPTDGLQFGTNSNSCEANVLIPSIGVTDNCADASNVTVTVTSAFGDIDANGGLLTNIPKGVHTITYIATDPCGNTSTCDVALEVVDDDAPVAICDEETVVSLTSDGTAEICWPTFDDGSYDNCEILAYRVKRMDDPNNVPFTECVSFDCEDVGNTIMVRLRVYDIVGTFNENDPTGRFNECMVEVTVQDKLPPTLVCPPNKTFDCWEFDPDVVEEASQDPNSGPPLFFNGEQIGFYPGVSDNCEVTEVVVNQSGDTDNCGEGQFTRVFTATDASDNTVSCVQIITVENSSPFFITDQTCNNPNPNDGVIWPCDIDLTTCGAGLTPEELDSEPVIIEDVCDLIGVTFSDITLSIQDPGCFKVLRTWQVVDWCQPDPSFPLGYATWTYLQEINVLESEAPIITSTCEDVTICGFDADCDPFPADLVLEATDDCTDDEDLNYFYKIDAFNNGTVDFDSDFNPAAFPNNEENEASGEYPIGTHLITWKVEDGCGNITTCEYLFTIQDCKLPTPICINSITTVVMPNSGEITLEPLFFEDQGFSFDNCTAFEDLLFSFSSDVNDTLFTVDCGLLQSDSIFQIELWATDEAGNQDRCTTFVEVQDPTGVCDPQAPTATVAGMLETEDFEGIGNALVQVSDASTSPVASQTTVGDGAFNFDLELFDNYTIEPEKNINPINGVTTFDLVLISQHILGVDPLDSPYQLIAADASNDALITTFDIVQLRQLILYIINEFPNNKSWRFVDQSYVFPDPTNPFVPPYPEVININNLSQDVLDNDFIGVKIGDIDGSAVPNNLTDNQTANRNIDEELTFAITDRSLRANNQVKVAFNASDFNNVLGYQFTLNFDKEVLEFVDVEASGLTGLSVNNFGLAKIDEGIITTSWNANGVDLSDGEELFVFTFNVKEDAKLSEALKVSSEYTKAEAYNTDLEIMGVALRFDGERESVTVGNGFELYQNQPNPFRNETLIGFYLPEATKATLKIYNVGGELLRVIEGDYAKGYNAISINKSDLPGNGMLYYQLETPTNTATKKMLIIE